jgi:glycosyltransferase involved in cell wall biosynthesis
VISETLDDQRLRSLYRSATQYLSMSFGEGWDLAAMEAAAAGLRLLVPRHTAYAENYREGEVDFLPARLVPAVVTGRTGAEDAVLFDGLRWWEPDEDAAVAAIRAAIHGEAAPVSPPGPRLATERTWDEAARRLLHALGRLA